MKKTSTCLAVVFLTLCLTSNLWALGMEDFGNAPLNEGNYRDVPNIMPLVNDSCRVYHRWVNGNEQFYYRGDTKALNEALKRFAAVKAESHEVLLQPGPGMAHSFDRAKTIPYHWNLHIVGGVVRHMTTLDPGDKIWSKSPMMTVCIGGEIDLTKVEIPEGVSVVDLTDLSRRSREALTSKDKNQQLKATIEKTIEKIEQAEDTTAAEQEYRLIEEQIREFCRSRKQ